MAETRGADNGPILWCANCGTHHAGYIVCDVAMKREFATLKDEAEIWRLRFEQKRRSLIRANRKIRELRKTQVCVL